MRARPSSSPRCTAGSRFAGAVSEGFAVRDGARDARQLRRRDGRGQPQRDHGQGIRGRGTPHRAADARALPPRLHRCRRLGHPRRPGRGTGYLANRLGELGKGLAAFADEMGAAWRDSTVVVDQRVRPHVQGERQPRHRPWPRQRLLGARRRRARRARRRRAGRGRARAPVPEPRLPGAERIPRRARRPVRAPLRTLARAGPEGVPGQRAEDLALV